MSNRLAGIAGVALLVGLIDVGCSPRGQAGDEAAPARDTASTKTDSVARRDTIRAQPDSAQQGQGGLRVSRLEYEGWRQYSVNCARCHGQDVLPNPVAANLLISVAPGGPVDSEQKFIQVVSEGRPDRGMPAFKSLPPDQIKAIYAYVRGRAEKRIPPGRPEEPA